MNYKKSFSIFTIFLIMVLFSAIESSASPGSLDPAFGGGGFITSLFAGSAYTSAVQSDEKIIVVGRSNEQGFTLIRYNPNGSLDTSFGIDGKVITDIPGDNEI